MRLINADALIQSLEKKHEHWHELVSGENKDIEFAHSFALNVIRNAPTADAKPTVIQSKTLFPTKDFMEWAKRIKEVNPNAVVIPCDAEVASAEAVSREVYEETDGVVTIEKQNAKEVGEIKHIVIRSPNYTRYFYNESMPLPAEAVQIPIKLEKRYPESKDEDITDAFMRGYLAGRSSAEAVQGEWVDTGNWMGIECSRCKCHSRYVTPFCPQCGARMKGGDSE